MDTSIIDLSSSEAEEEAEAKSNSFEPKTKKLKLDKPKPKSEVIVLTDEEDHTPTNDEKQETHQMVECLIMDNGKNEESNDLKENNSAVKKDEDNEITEEVNPLLVLETPETNDKHNDNVTSEFNFINSKSASSSKTSDESEEESSIKYKSESSSVLQTQTLPKELENFFDLCRTLIKHESTLELFEKKLPIVQKNVLEASEFIETDEFKEFLSQLTQQMKENRGKVINIFAEFHNKIIENRNEMNEEQIDDKIDRLYDLLGKLKPKVDHLAVQEVDLDEDENSSYMMFQKYKEKAAQVVRKIRKLENRDEYHGIAYYSRLDFARSKYYEFNIALNQKYADRKAIPFPTLYDVDKCLRKTVVKHKMEVPEAVLKSEIKVCFEELGKLIQRKRKQDLAQIHVDYLPNLVSDPALDDPELKRKLEENQVRASEAMEQILTKYTSLQEEGYVDSDDSKATNSEVEEEEEEEASNEDGAAI